MPPILDSQRNIRYLVDLTTQTPSHSYDYTAFGKRLYDPSLSRWWLTTDPAGFVDSMNLYAYVLNNPFLYLAPDGEAIGFAISLTALYGAWSTGGMTAAAAVIGGASNAMGVHYSFDLPYHMTKKAEKEKKKDRTEPKELREQLALEEAKAGAGEKIEKLDIKDPKYPKKDWQKMQHQHKNSDGFSSTFASSGTSGF